MGPRSGGRLAAKVRFVGIGRRADLIAGALSKLLHLRRAERNTVGDLDPYLDLLPEEMFPEPPLIPPVHQERSLLSRAIRTTTLSWTSTHEVICPKYRERHAGEYRANQVAWARWYRPAARRRASCLVYVHGWLEPGSWVEEATLFPKWAQALDVDMVHLALPFHGRRNSRSALFSGEYFFTADLVRSLEGIRQATHDARSIVGWLREQGYEQVGVTGLSLGGCIVMLLACLEPSPDYFIPIICHLNLESAVETAPILWRMKHDLERWGIKAERRQELFRRIGWSGYRPLVGSERQLWIEADEDVYIDPQLVRRQAEDWGDPEIYWVPGGHMTFPLHIDAITGRMAAFRRSV